MQNLDNMANIGNLENFANRKKNIENFENMENLKTMNTLKKKYLQGLVSHVSQTFGYVTLGEPWIFKLLYL